MQVALPCVNESYRHHMTPSCLLAAVMKRDKVRRHSWSNLASLSDRIFHLNIMPTMYHVLVRYWFHPWPFCSIGIDLIRQGMVGGLWLSSKLCCVLCGCGWSLAAALSSSEYCWLDAVFFSGLFFILLLQQRWAKSPLCVWAVSSRVSCSSAHLLPCLLPPPSGYKACSPCIFICLLTFLPPLHCLSTTPHNA